MFAGDNEAAKETKKRIAFYSWVPRFCSKVTYTPENVKIVNEFTRDEEEEREIEEVEDEEGAKEGEEKKEKKEEKKEEKEPKIGMKETIQLLRERNDEVSSELLAAVIYHHYHGSVEDSAFDALKARAKDNEFVGGIENFENFDPLRFFFDRISAFIQVAHLSSKYLHYQGSHQYSCYHKAP